MMKRIRRTVLICSIAVAQSLWLYGGVSVFQEGLNGYQGTKDTQIRGASPDRDDGDIDSLNPDGSDGGAPVHVLIRFDDIFGDGLGQVPAGVSINLVSLRLQITNPGTPINMHQMLVPWDESSTWNSFDPDLGIEADGITAALDADTQYQAPVGERIVDLPASTVQAWLDGKAENHGWVMLPTGNNGVDFPSSENADKANRPKLTVVWGEKGQPFARGIIARAGGFDLQLQDGLGAGASKIDPNSIKITFGGQPIEATISKDGDITTASYQSPTFFKSGESLSVTVEFTNDATPPKAQTDTLTFVVPQFVTVPASAKIENYKGTKRGFKMRVLQASTGLANSVSVREQHLAGLLTDANGDPLENIADDFFFDKDGTVTVDLINFDQDGNPQGVFRDSGSGDATDVPDDFIPGIPGLDGGNDNITAEILTVVDIPKAGLMRFAFNSDDGFKTSGGNTSDVFDSLVLGIFDGGRGASTTFYDVVFEEPGFYKLRSIWFEGGGGANLEWWTADSNNDPIALLNDDKNGGLKTWGQPIPGDPAAVQSISPSNGQGEIAAAGTQISVTIQDGSTTVDTGSISMTFNGGAVTPKVNSSGGTTTITFDTGPLPGNTTFDWSLNFKAGTLERTVAASFRTTVLAGDGLLFIETEDFDFGKGNWDKSNPIGMTGPYPGGTYQDLGDGIDETDVNAGTDFGVDYFEVASGSSQAIYRPDTGVEAGKMNGPAGFFRGAFDVKTNHVVGWNDAGDWYNYTRTFPDPAQKYNVFGRLSSGGSPIQASLSKVTSGVGTATQEVEPLGIWTPGRATAGWDSFEIFPLLAPGAAPGDTGPPAVVELGGTTTLRLSVLPGAHDSDFIVFLPAKEAAAPGEITKVSLEGGNIVIEFTGTLESADAVTGPFAAVAGASSPFSVAPQGAAKFYIVR